MRMRKVDDSIDNHAILEAIEAPLRSEFEPHVVVFGLDVRPSEKNSLLWKIRVSSRLLLKLSRILLKRRTLFDCTLYSRFPSFRLGKNALAFRNETNLFKIFTSYRKKRE